MSLRVVEHRTHFVIHIKWDNYTKRDIEVIKKIPGKTYNPLQQVWIAPLTSRYEVEDLKKSCRAVLMKEEHQKPEMTGVIPALPEPTIIPPVKNITMRHYQLQGSERMVFLNSCINGDDPGLGKTIQTICALAVLKKFPAVVICPATLKLNWKSEIEKFSGLKAMILEDSNKNSWMRYYEAGRADIFITNYESMRKYFIEKMPDTKRFMAKSIVPREEWSKVRCLVADESHRLKDPTTMQSRILLRLGFQKEHVYLLTGTPVVNKPIDLYPQLAIMGKLHHFGDKKGFIERYCDGGTGANNLKELNFLLNKYCYFKRNKRDVLTEIPPKQRQTLICEISNRKEYELAESEFRRWLVAGGVTEKGIEAKMRAEMLVKMGVLRKISAIGKIPTVIEYAEDIISSGEKVVLFAHHREVFEKLYAHFPDALFVTGGISQERREANVQAFQNDPRRKLIICGNKPGGVGITLTASSNIGIIEYPWHWAECQQIEDRCDRIGQLNAVMATYFFGKDTIDQRLFDIIAEKKEIANTISGSEDNIPVSTINKIMNLFN